MKAETISKDSSRHDKQQTAEEKSSSMISEESKQLSLS